jgi:hypothetical protein
LSKRTSTKIYACTVAIAAVMSAGCTTTPTSSNSWDSKVYIESNTDVPSKYIKAEKRFNNTKSLVMPQESLRLSRIKRPRAEVRRGPGVQFQLVDSILSNQESVILFERVGVWQKIFEPLQKLEGWVHHKVLETPWVNKSTISVEVDRLPTVFAMDEINSIYSFPLKKQIQFRIPKGAIFRSIASSKFGTLVWLHQNNSVLWIEGKAVR